MLALSGDVKPSNFMLTRSLQCKLGDFGISRLFDLHTAGGGGASGGGGGGGGRGAAAVAPMRLVTPAEDLEQTSNW